MNKTSSTNSARKGRIVVLSGPSGSGKTTLYKKLLKSKRLQGKLVKSVSVTTRPIRPGEILGRDYCFVSRKMFRYKQRAGHFLESQRVFDNYYGTPSKNVFQLLSKGKSVLLCIDVKGAQIVSKKIPSAIKIFIKTPSLKDLKQRLSGRGSEAARSLKIRLETARAEIKAARRYDYIVVNDHLQKAYSRLEKICISVL